MTVLLGIVIGTLGLLAAVGYYFYQEGMIENKDVHQKAREVENRLQREISMYDEELLRVYLDSKDRQ